MLTQTSGVCPKVSKSFLNAPVSQQLLAIHLRERVEDSMVAVFGDPVQHREAGDEVSFVEQGRVLSEQRVDVSPGA